MIPRGDLKINTKEDPKRQADDWTLVAGVSILLWMSRVTRIVVYGSSSIHYLPAKEYSQVRCLFRLEVQLLIFSQVLASYLARYLEYAILYYLTCMFV